MTTTTASSTSYPSTTAPRILAGLIGAVAAGCVVTSLIALVALALGASHELTPLRAASYLPAVAVGVVLGSVGWAVVRRTSQRPARLLRVLVPTVVGVSLVPDALLLVTGEPGADLLGVAALMTMHVAVTAVAVPLLAWAMPVGRVR